MSVVKACDYKRVFPERSEGFNFIVFEQKNRQTVAHNLGLSSQECLSEIVLIIHV